MHQKAGSSNDLRPLVAVRQSQVPQAVHRLRVDSSDKISKIKIMKTRPFTRIIVYVQTDIAEITLLQTMTSSGQRTEEMLQWQGNAKKSAVKVCCGDNVMISLLMCTGSWLMASSWSHLTNLSFHHIGVPNCTLEMMVLEQPPLEYYPYHI